MWKPLSTVRCFKMTWVHEQFETHVRRSLMGWEPLVPLGSYEGGLARPNKIKAWGFMMLSNMD